MIGWSIEGEARLDRRDDLLRALDLAEDPSRSDLELILGAFARWGDRCPERLLGDFAFVVRDHATGRIFGARDPLGVKPFYYRAVAGSFAYASTAGAVADGLPLELDEARVADALLPQLEGLDHTSTFHRGVLRLPPGHKLVVEGGRPSITCYWAPDPNREIRLSSDAAYEDAFSEVFTEAVRCRLESSTAAMLSGGLDSSAVCGVARSLRMAAAGPPIVTLSAVTDDPACEETRCIRSVLGSGGYDPATVPLSGIEGFESTALRFLETLEEPFDAAMIIPLLMNAQARRLGFTSVLDGVDGDCATSLEPGYLIDLIRGRNWRTAAREASGLARFYDGTYAPWSSRTRLLAGGAARAFAPRFARNAAKPLLGPRRLREALDGSILRPDFARRVRVADRLDALASHRAREHRGSAGERHAAELTHPHIAAALERYDRVARSQGVEPRHPFFDRRVVEFCLALPWDQKVRDGWSKFILRRATKGLLPDDVRWRRGRWIRLGPSFLERLIARNRRSLQGAIEAHARELEPFVAMETLRATQDGETLWQAAALGFWLRRSRDICYAPPRLSRRTAAIPCRPVAG